MPSQMLWRSNVQQCLLSIFSNLSRPSTARSAPFLMTKVVTLAISWFWRISFNINIIYMTPHFSSVYSSSMATRKPHSGFVQSSNEGNNLSNLMISYNGHCQYQHSSTSAWTTSTWYQDFILVVHAVINLHYMMPWISGPGKGSANPMPTFMRWSS